MHIAEGMLPASQAIGYGIGAGIWVAAGIHSLKAKSKELPMVKQLTGVMTAGIFLVSLLPIPVPMTGTSSHPGGTPLGAILLGPGIAVLMSLVALLFQALFFAHGGLTTLGANTLSMGGIGGIMAWVIFWGVRRLKGNLFWAAVLAGFIGDLMIYMGTSAELAVALHGTHPIMEVFPKIFLVFMPTQFPLALLEGLFTGYVIQYIAKHRPDILIQLRVIREDEVNQQKIEN